jgi:hypothetical protein
MNSPAVRLARPPGRPHSIAHLQALDDAIRYRAARLKAPCRSCRPTAPCDAHSRDLSLLKIYNQMARAAVADLEHARQLGQGLGAALKPGR